MILLIRMHINLIPKVILCNIFLETISNKAPNTRAKILKSAPKKRRIYSQPCSAYILLTEASQRSLTKNQGGQFKLILIGLGKLFSLTDAGGDILLSITSCDHPQMLQIFQRATPSNKRRKRTLKI